MKITIRKEAEIDTKAIHKVNFEAFGREDEANLVALLRQAGQATVSLVAVDVDRVIGHVLFSPLSIEPAAENFLGMGHLF